MLTPHRGAILKCRFPFQDIPHRPGPAPHYCLFANALVEQTDGRVVLVVAYGTSRLDEQLIESHGSGAGILSVDSRYVRGQMGGPVTHFLARHVAVVPATWIYPAFNARLDFIRPEARANDQYRQNLFRKFEAFEAVLDEAAAEVLDYFMKTGRVGLRPGTRLRHRKP